MHEPSKDITSQSVEQKITIQIITFSTIIIVIILTLISFIHIYANKKDEVIKDMDNESNHLETIITDNLNYSKYFVNLVGQKILDNPTSINYINNTLNNHFISTDFNHLFGWRKYSWINKNHHEIVTSNKGIMFKPKYVKYIEKFKKNSANIVKNIGFYNQSYVNKSNSLKIIDNLYHPESNEYIGSIVLSYDIETLINSLNSKKKNDYTNFVILATDNLDIVAQSHDNLSNIITEETTLTKEVYNRVKAIKNDEAINHLDMVSGLNFHISKLENLPFILIVNINNEVIKKDIIEDLTKSFIMVCIFASLSMLAIIFIYRRETYLRTKSEKALLLARHATNAKTSFLAFTAHEIRSPLGFILTGSEMMQKELFGTMPTEYKKYVSGIHKNSKVILDFITDILDENQIIEGKFKVVKTMTDISEIISEAKQLNLARFNKRKIIIKYDIEEKLPLLICDRRRIVQVLNNLISNSIKYSKDGTEINISAKICDHDFHIDVVDQGIGMDEKEIPVALSAYGTLHDGNYQKTGSYGLGLTIVKMLLDAHDAKFYISSVKDKGTSIKIIFPKYKLVYANK